MLVPVCLQHIPQVHVIFPRFWLPIRLNCGSQPIEYFSIQGSDIESSVPYTYIYFIIFYKTKNLKKL